ncbi:MAG: glycosyltransferase [Candidatus Sericytochromatia bacterium]
MKNNFSIARNECISYATGDWILSIDADQRITENSKNLFSKLIWNKEKIDIYKFKIIHTNEYHPFKEQIKTFLFRNNINLKYKNKIHEILDSKGILKEKVISDIEIIHDNGSDYNELEEQSKVY